MLRISPDREKITNMMEEMNRLGITETTIFPDLEGLSREIQAEYGISTQICSIPK
jgi:diaminopimelate decarboxylase